MKSLLQGSPWASTLAFSSWILHEMEPSCLSFPPVKRNTKTALQRNCSPPEAKCVPDTVSIPVSPFLAKNNIEQTLEPQEPSHPMGVSCSEQETSRDEVTKDTNENLGMSWNRQSQPHSLARHVGKAPSQLCVGSQQRAKSSGDPLVQALIWAMANL